MSRHRTPEHARYRSCGAGIVLDFFRKDRIIAIYIGSDAAAMDGIRKVMGPQFAGR